MKFFIEDNWKKFRSEHYNYDFNMSNGTFMRWGKTKDVDPEFSPYGPEILDQEVSTSCRMGCPFCYKSNTANGRHMTFETFKMILDKFPKYNGIHFLTQVAFGIGDIDVSDDLWKMMEYCREEQVIPNITINGTRMTKSIVNKLSSLCGAISVSRYENKNICYDAVKKLSDKGMDQINIHQLVSEETYDQIIETLYDIKNDPRLKKLNAIVFLSLKQKGRGEHFNQISMDKFSEIVAICIENDIVFGFDSCGANKVTTVFKQMGILHQYDKYIEPCESGSFSSYINIDAVFHPCSFSNNCTLGIDVTKANDFLDDIWNARSTRDERNKIHLNGRSCPYFNV